MSFQHTRKWEQMLKEEERKRQAQRVNLLKKDCNPNPDYHRPHNLLLTRKPECK